MGKLLLIKNKEDINFERITSALMDLEFDKEGEALDTICCALIDHFANIDDDMSDACYIKAVELRALVELMFQS